MESDKSACCRSELSKFARRATQLEIWTFFKIRFEKSASLRFVLTNLAPLKSSAPKIGPGQTDTFDMRPGQRLPVRFHEDFVRCLVSD